MSVFSIGPYEQFEPPFEPYGADVELNTNGEMEFEAEDATAVAEKNDPKDAWEWVYDHTKLDAQGNPIKIGPWNDRLTDIVNWIPGALRDTELTEFVSIYQDLINRGLYTTPCKWSKDELETSQLKKIEKILDFRDPSEIDETFIQNYADLLGFSATSLDSIGKLSGDSDDDRYNRCRELIRSIPFLEANKTTETAMMLLLGLLGQTFEFKVMRLGSGRTGNDYDNCYWEDEGNPTPHFGLELPLGASLDENVGDAVNQIIESIRPINTVYEGISWSENIDVSLGSDAKDGDQWKNEPTMRVSATVYNNQFMITTDAPVYEVPEKLVWIDPRDGQEYGYKNISDGDGHTLAWMLRNFNFGVGDNITEQIGYGKKRVSPLAAEDENYGGLYEWKVAFQSTPNGWHIPDDSEMRSLINSVGGVETAGKKLKAKPPIWDGEDEIGFNLLPNGSCYYFNSVDFEYTGQEGICWSSSPASTISSIPDEYCFEISGSMANARTSSDGMSLGSGDLGDYWSNSVRLVKNTDDMDHGIFVDDRDGKVYRWKKIGNLYWMIDNLEFGTVVPDSTTTLNEGEAWKLKEANARIGAPHVQDFYIKRTGYSYSRSVAEYSCPNGWRLPTKEDWENLRDYFIGQYGGTTTTETRSGCEYWDTTEIGSVMKTNRCWWLISGNNASGWYGLPTAEESTQDLGLHNYARYHCHEVASSSDDPGVYKPYFTTLSSVNNNLYLRSGFYYDYYDPDFEPHYDITMDNNINAAIRCCRSDLPDTHTEEDWHNWYGQQ